MHFVSNSAANVCVRVLWREYLGEKREQPLSLSAQNESLKNPVGLWTKLFYVLGGVLLYF